MMGEINKTALSMAEIKKEETKQVSTFDLQNKRKTVMILKGESATIAEVKGEGYISQLWTTFTGWFWRSWDPTQEVNQSILKTLIIKLYWDGSDVPAVSSPVGDFFGNGLNQMTSFCSDYFGMSSGGFYSKFPMPFKRGFKLEIENKDASLDVEVFINMLYQLTEIPKDTGYFHAQFRTGVNSGPDPMIIAEAEGRGHYVGCSVSMQAEKKHYLSFLEAPEYVYVDQKEITRDTTPSIVGTGLEDYFLGGWYFREGPFIGPLHGVPIKNTLHSTITMYRVHELDAIRFNESLAFHFVNPWKPERLSPFAFSSTAFLYLDNPEGANVPIPSNETLLCWHHTVDTDHIISP